MFDNYYDVVSYEKKSDTKDNYGNEIYKEIRNINVRYVGGGEEFIISKDEFTNRHTKEYQIPFMIKEGDKIDGRLVMSVEPSKDVFGKFHFCIVKVE